MKKWIAIALIALTAAGIFSGCGAEKKDVLKVALSPDYAPMEFVDLTKTGQDQFVGFDVSLAKYIAAELDMDLQISPMDFNACQAAVSTGNVDMALSGFSWMPEREENYNLSDFYYAGENETEQVLITLATNGDKYATLDSLAGLKVGAQSASLQEALVKDQLPDCELVSFTTIDTGLLMLQKGDFEVMAVATGNADAIITNNPQYAKSGFRFEVDEKLTNYLILMQKGNDELTAKVNAALAKAKAAGYYETWYAEAQAIAGVEISFDESGNAVTEPSTN